MKNKIISVILAICMFVSILSPVVTVMAENTDMEQNGYFGEEAEVEVTAPEIAVDETLDEISSDEELISQEDIEEYVSQAEEIIRQVEDTSAESSISRFRRSINAVELDGDGTEDSPYLIKSREDLQYLADVINNGYSFSGEYIRLHDDIDLSESAFMRIGTPSYPFKGVFQGNDKKISNITISESSSGHQGLFGYINGAKIENVVLENANVEGYTYSGTLVGRALNSVITGCMSNGP